MYSTPLVELSLFALVGLLSVAYVRAEEPELFAGLKHNQLFAALKLTVERSGGAGPAGRGYVVDSSRLPVRIREFQLGVHPSRKAAEPTADRLRYSPQIPRLSYPDTWAGA